MAPVKVAVAGATGNIGLPVVKALLDANYSVIALTRKGSNSASKLPQSSNLAVKEVDYTSVPDLTAALEGVKVVVSTLATSSIGEQNPLIDASIAAGVERFLPSEFGSDTCNPKTAALPVFKFKVATQEYLKTKVSENPKFSYTLVITGPFFDWGLQHGFFLNPAKHTGTLYNGGDVVFSTTTLGSIAQAVVGVVGHLAETANRPVYVHDTATTQNKLIAYAKEKDGKDWDTSVKSTKDIYQESMTELTKGGDIGKAMVGFILSSIFGGEEMGGTFVGRTDNALLGLKELSEQQVKEIIQSLV
ncbi:uncharacterized protein Z520_04172 [Fonsecaea multimorphosa CBS 102226]|uniref:NmrA-like domain-containing protein n=1 Tax=Fonsecaea multimorphosa CBS 102226 TaxID=1442371 RepID=A0A0D2IU28_9EURO|nr:uncharacterized protein Z520_04172 [Fonsecaea multimorphosa CBS 102226]KIY00487.1 hypothetical protein Z520_04172 [Fonsecaea multimorphosa CBS 102226]OAL27001.1 hypothetical protein AYO22_03945 [Fonsecaea multimorphosa]